MRRSTGSAGQIPPGGALDVKTLAREAGVSRAALYRTWGHLKDEFEQRRTAAWAAGQQPDAQQARIARLRNVNERLTGKLARTNTELVELKERHRSALSAPAAKDDELQRLRRELAALRGLVRVPGQGQVDDTRSVLHLLRFDAGSGGVGCLPASTTASIGH